MIIPGRTNSRSHDGSRWLVVIRFLHFLRGRIRHRLYWPVRECIRLWLLWTGITAIVVLCHFSRTVAIADDLNLFIPFEPTSQLRIGFIPGDAIFPVALEFPHDIRGSADLFFPRNEGETHIDFRYQYPTVPDGAGQQEYLGFANLRITQIDKRGFEAINDFVGLLGIEAASIAIDSAKRPESEEAESTAIVVVNRTFPWDKRRFFVRYNESWMKGDRPEFWPGTLSHDAHGGVLTGAGFYQPHVFTIEAVIEDWIHGKDVAPLQIRLPSSTTYEIKDGRREITEPVEIEFARVAIVGFPKGTPDSIFRHKTNSTFYVASEKGVVRYRWIISDIGEGYTGKKLVEEVMFVSGENVEAR